MPQTRDTSTGAFERVYVDYAIAGTARVTWELRRRFLDPEPYSFQLQANKNWDETDPVEDLWENVGAPTANYTATDTTKRQFGTQLRIAYRVELTTPLDTYTSEPAQVLGQLTMRQWLEARAIIRRAQLQPRGREAFTGYLWKRKLHGTACPVCVDQISGAITDPNCTTCNGTGKQQGYWQAAENTLFDMSPEAANAVRSELGTADNSEIAGKFIAIPMVHAEDVWVDAVSDRRYYITEVQTAAEIARVPILAQAKLKLAPFTDIIYDVDVE